MVRQRFLIGLVACLGMIGEGLTAQAQFTSGTIVGTGLGSNPGGRDSNWNIVAVPTGFTPPSGQSTPYNAYVPYAAPGVFIGGGSPQTGLVYLGGTNY